jgi:hypothetical protein
MFHFPWVFVDIMQLSLYIKSNRFIIRDSANAIVELSIPIHEEFHSLDFATIPVAIPPQSYVINRGGISTNSHRIIDSKTNLSFHFQ